MARCAIGPLKTHYQRLRTLARPKPRRCLSQIADRRGPEIIAKYWEGLYRCLDDGCIELEFNAVERTIRPIALNRKNALFTGHGAGAQNWAIIASLIKTRKLDGIEPHGYLSRVLMAIAGGHRQTDINLLLPWN